MQEFLNLDRAKPWELDIINKYPLIYLEPNPELKQWYKGEKYEKLINNPNFVNLRYNFECGEGWAALIDKFSKVAQDLIISLRVFGQQDAKIHSFISKSKFGRYEHQGFNNLIHPFKSLFRAYEIEIENKSTHICEECGKYGKLRQGNWWHTLCDACSDKY